MTTPLLALMCLAGFVLPVPLLAWLDRPRAGRSDGRGPSPRQEKAS